MWKWSNVTVRMIITMYKAYLYPKKAMQENNTKPMIPIRCQK